ncbi:MAG: nitrate reductase subunit alpha [Bacteroidetes bacterium]|nr:nitrate reductase subunit alpha [Bacteroidota bacterium]
MAWIKDLFAPDQRSWEEFYRNRWQYDKVVRSTHGVNCTGSCSWNIFVKGGIVTWEMQALDYPVLQNQELPPYEPRGCQRGISYSWYLYSPIRVKYPYIRGVLADLWQEAKAAHPDDILEAWRSIVTDPEKRSALHRSRGKGGFRRMSWDEAHEIMAIANIYTVLEHGSDRIIGFSPIPAMSMLSYAGGSRLMQLMGGVSMSFYDWYCDLPPASPEVWGEQTDVAESADWYNSKYIATVGSNVLMTRTPDSHFLVEARHRGSKVAVFSPDFSQTSKVADEWFPIHQGQDGAFWMAVNHVLLREYYIKKQVPYFLQYLQRYSDAPFLVVMDRQENGTYRPGKLLRASQLHSTAHVENAEWKTFVWDAKTDAPVLPPGTVGHRWQSKKGEWNLQAMNSQTGDSIEPVLFFSNGAHDLTVELDDFSDGSMVKQFSNTVPCRQLKTNDGECYVTTAFELMLAQFNVNRSGDDRYEESMELPFTPKWQEQFTGINAADVIRFAKEWGHTAERTNGQVSVIIGAGVNHWYHNNLIYRSIISALIFSGAVGVNGGGLNHYVGQEKLVPQASWGPIAFGTDWGGPPRLMNTPSFHYMHSSQWRYDGKFPEVCPVNDSGHPMAHGHTADKQALAVRSGWLPCFPQFNKSNFAVVKEAIAAGAKDDAGIIEYVKEQLKNGKLRSSMEDPDNPASFPRVWYIWRGNALLSSAKGHEYFLKHYLGTHHNSIAEENAKDDVEDVIWKEQAQNGKFDLIVDINFRMDSSALYSDIVLPTATYYEKNDLSSTDMHSFIHPLQAAVPPAWESRSDWEIFKGIAQKVSELAERYIPEPLTDIVASPLMHDTPAEIAQPHVKDWKKGECAMIPGTTMPNLKIVKRDYVNLYNKFITAGPNFRNNGLGIHGTTYMVDDVYDEYLKAKPTHSFGGGTYPSLKDDKDACNLILWFAAETNGELAYRAYASESKKTGIDHTHLAEGSRNIRITFEDISTQPRRTLTTPFWTGITNNGRAYSAYCQNVEELVPWRTLTGRQHLYLDHDAYIAYGEHLPTYKPRADRGTLRDLVKSNLDGEAVVLNYLTPHGKWHIHSTMGDTLRMETLSRGMEPIWISDKDAERLGIKDNDWVEVYNDHGVVCTRAVVSHRIPGGMCMIYHAPERTLSVPKSQERGNRRAGGHNSLTRVRLKPLFMIGGYAQFTYGFNYWGPQGVNRDTFVAVRKLKKLNW